MYTIETASTISLFSSAVMRYEVNKHINVRAHLLPFDVAGSGANAIHGTSSERYLWNS